VEEEWWHEGVVLEMWVLCGRVALSLGDGVGEAFFEG
jgi:hypothetical protein